MQIPLMILLLFSFCLISYEPGAQSRNVLQLGTVENLPPFSFYEKNKLKGIDVDVINIIADRLNIPIEIKPLPWARVIAELKVGSIDGAFSVYDNNERKEYAIYLGIMHFDNLGIVTRREKSFIYKDIKSLYGKVIGKGLGVFVSDDFDDAVSERKFVVEEINDTNMSNIRKLYSGRIDASIGVVETMLFYSNALGYGDQIVRIQDYIEVGRPGYLVLSKYSQFMNNQELIAKIKNGIKSVMTDGTYDYLKKIYNIE